MLSGTVIAKKDVITEGQLNDLDLWYRKKQITNE